MQTFNTSFHTFSSFIVLLVGVELSNKLTRKSSFNLGQPAYKPLKKKASNNEKQCTFIMTAKLLDHICKYSRL